MIVPTPEQARHIVALASEVIALDPRADRLPEADPAAWRAIGRAIGAILDAAQEAEHRGH